jgi:hypothetical protein
VYISELCVQQSAVVFCTPLQIIEVSLSLIIMKREVVGLLVYKYIFISSIIDRDATVLIHSNNGYASVKDCQ